jgi:hypothetical protein
MNAGVTHSNEAAPPPPPEREPYPVRSSLTPAPALSASQEPGRPDHHGDVCKDLLLTRSVANFEAEFVISFPFLPLLERETGPRFFSVLG